MKKRILVFMFIAAMLLTACGKDTQGTSDKDVRDDVAISDIYSAVKDAYGDDYLPSMQYDEEALINIVGLDSTLCEEYIAEVPMISANVDTFIAVKATDGNISKVVDVLNAYRERLVNDTMQYPMNQIKIQASRVVNYGDYAFFIMLGLVPSEVEEQDDETILAAYEEQNQKAVDVIEGMLK